jgi:phage FluMu gp28-like protein
MKIDRYFMPYQQRWLNDKSRTKMAVKSRRVGLTYAQSYEDVRDAVTGDGMDVYFSSADEDASKRYIKYCVRWARIMNLAFSDLGERIIDERRNIKVKELKFDNSKTIFAMTSNPRAFRSTGGKVVLDEFAHHEDQKGMWKAARPATTWGFPVRMISSLNGTGNLFYDKWKEAERPNSTTSVHFIDIYQAVNEGLADRICDRPLSAEERAAWIANEKRETGDEDTWAQEYECKPLDEDSIWLGWDDVVAAAHDDAGKPDHYAGGNCYVGWDVALVRDLSVIWVLEKVGDVLVTREVITMKKSRTAEQLAELARVFSTYRVIRAVLDESGLGKPFVHLAQDKHGVMRVEGLVFGLQSKATLAHIIKAHFENRTVRVPRSDAIRNSHRAVKAQKIPGTSAKRFDAERTEHGHADEFWAHALALYAADSKVPPPARGATVPNQENKAERNRSAFGRFWDAGQSLIDRWR